MLFAGKTIVSAPLPLVHPPAAVSLLADVIALPKVHVPPDIYGGRYCWRLTKRQQQRDPGLGLLLFAL
jgi:hypothetical protein